MATDEIILSAVAPAEVCERLRRLLGPLEGKALGYEGKELGPGSFALRHVAMVGTRGGGQVRSATRFRALVSATPTGTRVVLDDRNVAMMLTLAIVLAPVVLLWVLYLSKMAGATEAHRTNLVGALAAPIILTIFFGGGGLALARWSSRKGLRQEMVSLAQQLGAG